MSEITIRSGSVVEVDTESLRRVADSIRALSRDLLELIPQLTVAAELSSELTAGGSPASLVAAIEVALLRSAIEGAGLEGEELAEKVHSAASLYEAVELLVERDAAAAARDVDRVARIDSRLERLAGEDPRAVDRGRQALASASPGHGDLFTQAFLGAQLTGAGASWLAFPLVYGVVDALGFGAIPARARLSEGSDQPVRVRPSPGGSAVPPANLAAAAQRIPAGGAHAQMRVERYAMPDGTRQFAVYVAGTRSGVGEPFDMRSNLALYAGERSASYAAVTTALRDAGARRGDVVHAFGHSQGAMVLERLALEGPYDTRTLVSFGSPVQADVGPETLAVSLRHSDDPVAALQAGGHPAGVGSDGSFVVERLADPAPGAHDLRMPAHSLEAYTDTAAMVDASSDPRAAAVREAFETLGSAESGESTDFVAERVTPASDDAGRDRGFR